MNKTKQLFKYILSDFLASAIAWSVFFIYRKSKLEDNIFFDNFDIIINDPKFYLGLIFVPLFWLLLYYLAGYYRKIYRKARLKELAQTLSVSIIGVIILFFTLILNDHISDYRKFYEAIIILFSLQFSLTYLPRLFFTTQTVHKIHKKIIGFNTLLIGNSENAFKTYYEVENQKVSEGNKFIGFVNLSNNISNNKLKTIIPCLGDYNQLNEIIKKYNIEEIIIAPEKGEHELIDQILTILGNDDIIIKVIPELQHFLLGSIKTTSILYTPFILISPNIMPLWQRSIKRIFDIIFSIIAIIILLPVYIVTAICVKLSSPGKIIYAQERIGVHGNPFLMYKFRSMYADAEKAGPQLSSKNDSRITRFGKFMRKVRLDETPQFFNVLIGNMSLVGPRPERKYYVDQLILRAPHYKLLSKVKPGITSWGQVKFGYAENIDEMIERLKYDLLYIENMTIATDIKILLYTFIIIIQGRGK